MSPEPTVAQAVWADAEARRVAATLTHRRVSGWTFDPQFPHGVTILLAPKGSRFVYFPESLRPVAVKW